MMMPRTTTFSKSKFLKHTSCDVCGSRDAKALYSDGGSHCFSCGYTIRAGQDIDEFVPSLCSDIIDEPYEPTIDVPIGLGYNYSQECIDWLGQYDIGPAEIQQHRVKWNEDDQQLVFVYYRFDANSKIGAVQVRNFDKRKPKYLTSGLVNDVLPIFWGRSSHTSRIVIVEDAISAIKTSRIIDSMPILGSKIPITKLMALKRKGFNDFVIWLDHDKYENALEIADKCTYLGLKSQVIATDLDPKAYPEAEIINKLRKAETNGASVC